MTDHPPIDPPPPGAPRPFWSVMIPTFDPHPEYLKRALAAVLEQDPGPAEMEIALVDDHSGRVDPRECVPDEARDRISWFRQERHVGIGGNWNACLQRARGHWVHLLHQDDLVRRGFYQRLRAGIETAPRVGAAFCRDEVIDAVGRRILSQRLIRPEPGIVDDWIEHVFVGLALRASALVVKRGVYEDLGGFRLDLEYALDWDMWKRVAAAVPLWYEPEPLACYRRHGASASYGFLRSGANIAEIGRSIELSESALPPAVAAVVSRRARVTYTRYALRTAWSAFRAGDPLSALAQVRAACRLTSVFAVAREAGMQLARVRSLPR